MESIFEIGKYTLSPSNNPNSRLNSVPCCDAVLGTLFISVSYERKFERRRKADHYLSYHAVYEALAVLKRAGLSTQASGNIQTDARSLSTCVIYKTSMLCIVGPLEYPNAIAMQYDCFVAS